MSKIIEYFKKAKRIEEIINSCTTQQQLDNCEKWIEKIDIDEDYKSYFHLLLVEKSKQL